ncbi:MAG: M20/M25/M40 family metallo-hydrolase [Vicinamibacterales bacterium]
MRRMFVPLLMAGLVAVTLTARQLQEKVDDAMNGKIIAEGMNRSQIMRIEHMLADVYGPRLTGSPNHEGAAKWAVQEMTSWGMKNGKLEPWNWGHEGWLNERADGHVSAPVRINLVFAVQPWTPSTKGAVTAQAVNLIAPNGAPATFNPNASCGGGGRGAAAPPPPPGPTQAELDAYFAQMAPRVKGAVVLVGAPCVPDLVDPEQPKRRDDAAARAQYNPDPNAPPPAGRGNRGGGAPGGGGAQAQGATPVRLTTPQVNTQVADFLMKNGAAVRVTDARERLGVVRQQSGNGYDSSKNIPGVLLRNEDYGRIARILHDGTPVTMDFNIVNHVYPDGKTSYNAVAEIPGTDKADEVVMLGGHLDSWHSATGATDNGIGCAIMMEAARILQAVGAKPRRTIRVALWSGEEEGLLGSLAYVEQHFGTFEAPKEPEFSKLDAYWNIDSGTGRVRGASIFGPPEGARILAQFLKPFEDFGVYGATAGSSRSPGGTDSTSFNHAGLPGMGGGQDPIEYGSFTHHTSLDTYERILPDDVMKDAIVTASVVYHIAMRDQMMPRFDKEHMPPLPPARGGGAGSRG